MQVILKVTRHRLMALMLMLNVLLMLGCSSVPTAKLNHVFPPTGVKLPPGARIQVVRFDRSPATDSQLKMIRNILGRIDGIRVVTKQPDYWLVTGWISGYAQDSEQEARFSAKTLRGVTEGRAGGHENTVIQPQVTTSCAMVATFSLVKADDLTPVTIFNVGVYDSDFSPQAGRSRGFYEAAFRQSLETRLREVFIPGNRSVMHQTAMPENAPNNLVACLGQDNHLKQLHLIPFQQFCRLIKGGQFQGDREESLTLYFLNSLNQELRCTEPQALKTLHATYLEIIQMTQDESLLEATARALARVEEKLRVLGHKPVI